MKYILPSITLLLATGAHAELIIHESKPIIKTVVAPIDTVTSVVDQVDSSIAAETAAQAVNSVDTADSAIAQPLVIAPVIMSSQAVASDVNMAKATDATERHILGLSYAENAKPFIVFAEAGILGFGVGAGFSVNSYFDIVAGYNGGKYNVENLDFELTSGMKVDQVDYDSKVQYVAANIRPFAGAFHISLGLYNQDINFKGQYSPSDFYLDEDERPEYEFNHATFDANAVGNVKLDVNFDKKVLPYIGIGWSPKLSQRWGLSTQFGAMYAGEAQVAYYPENGNISIQDIDKTTTLGEALRVEEELFSSSLKWIPVAKLGLWIRF